MIDQYILFTENCDSRKIVRQPKQSISLPNDFWKSVSVALIVCSSLLIDPEFRWILFLSDDCYHQSWKTTIQPNHNLTKS